MGVARTRLRIVSSGGMGPSGSATSGNYLICKTDFQDR